MRIFALFILILCFGRITYGQHLVIRGTVINRFTKEKVSFASISWKKGGFGMVSDSAGNFRIIANQPGKDSLLVSSVGFETQVIPIPVSRDSLSLTVFLENAKNPGEVIVRSKYNKGLFWWRKIVANKKVNNPYKAESYAYELYNKLEIDIDNINRQKFEKFKLLRPFGFILDNIDSLSEDSPFLPVFITESISDCYFSQHPFREREEIKAMQANGIKNESILQFMGGLSQRINPYENYMTLFGKEFISPLSAVGDRYYNYKGLDTQYISGQRYLHLYFSPQREGENTFSGDCWVHQQTWAIKKISLNISATANINYVNRLSIVQEFARQNDSVWVFSKDKFVTELSFFKKDHLSFIARKTSLYNKVRINEPSIEDTLQKNSQGEKVVIRDSALVQDSGYWQAHRAEPLTVNEAHVYKMIDTLKSMPLFKKYVNTAQFIVDGRKQLGMVEIGPWFKWISGNQLEKFRIRFDLATTKKFNELIWLHGYLAYGFGDKALKGKAEVDYKFGLKSGYSTHISYTHDLNNGRARNNGEDMTTDNMFSQLIRRPGIRQKFLLEDEIRIAVKKEWINKFSAQVSYSRTNYETFNPLPPKKMISNNQDNAILNSELGLKLRYAPGEKVIRTRRKDFRLNGSYPVLEAGFYMGLPNLWESNYQYHKVNMSVAQEFRIPRWGKINYRVYGGEIFGDPLPFMLLEIHPGNEIYYYSKNSFNLMNRFEYISDRYAGFELEHNFEKKLLNLLPFMRKTNMRQFWNVKAVWGTLSKENKVINLQDFANYRFRSLNGNGYVEAGTGIDNLFKYFRVDLVWRFAPPQKAIPNIKNSTAPFGVFGSFHFQF
ncbi:DUF5686 and carboxypeptidase-like regulatory domain-containing protein [Flavitalea flava]